MTKKFIPFQILRQTILCLGLLNIFFAKSAKSHSTSLTLSPFYLENPVLRLSLEKKLDDSFSTTLILSAGSFADDDGARYWSWELSTQLRYYLIGSFDHGLLMGLQAGYSDASGKLINPIGSFAGIHGGGFLGYKYSSNIGLTFELGLGPAYLYVLQDPRDSELQTLVLFNLGWSY